MAKPKQQSTRSQSSSKNRGVLTVDEAFQRLLQIVEKPDRACGLLNWTFEYGDALLFRREKKRANRPEQVNPRRFAGNYNVVPVKKGGAWHGVVELRVGGFVAGEDPEKYIWTMLTKDIDKLCKEAKSTSPAGATRGRKPYKTWDVLQVRCIAWLYDEDVGAHTPTSDSEYANRLVDWANEHLDEEDIPDRDTIRPKAGDWIKNYKLMKELEDEANRKADREGRNSKKQGK
jgi:hypothetical protein